MFFITNICGFVSKFNIPIIQHLNHQKPQNQTQNNNNKKNPQNTDFLQAPAEYVQKQIMQKCPTMLVVILSFAV